MKATASVGRVGAPGDQPVALEIMDGLCHRLRAHVLACGQVADAPRALAVEATEYDHSPGRKPRLGAQSANEPAERLA